MPDSFFVFARTRVDPSADLMELGRTEVIRCCHILSVDDEGNNDSDDTDQEH